MTIAKEDCMNFVIHFAVDAVVSQVCSEPHDDLRVRAPREDAQSHFEMRLGSRMRACMEVMHGMSHNPKPRSKTNLIAPTARKVYLWDTCSTNNSRCTRTLMLSTRDAVCVIISMFDQHGVYLKCPQIATAHGRTYSFSRCSTLNHVC